MSLIIWVPQLVPWVKTPCQSTEHIWLKQEVKLCCFKPERFGVYSSITSSILIDWAGEGHMSSVMREEKAWYVCAVFEGPRKKNKGRMTRLNWRWQPRKRTDFSLIYIFIGYLFCDYVRKLLTPFIGLPLSETQDNRQGKSISPM